MKSMKRVAVYLSVVLGFFLLLAVSATSAQAAFLKFDKSTVSVNSGESFDIGIVVDAGTDSITSVDAYVLYDSTVLEPGTVTNGTFFPTVLNDITSTRVYVAGLVDDPATSKTGSGTIATVSFKALKAGTVTLSYNCGQTSENSQVIKNDINATDIIVCGSNETASVTASGSAVEPTSTPSASITPTELPKTGVFDNLVKVAVPGMILLLLGGALKLFLKF